VLARRLSRRARLALSLLLLPPLLAGSALYALWRFAPNLLPAPILERLPRSPEAMPVVYRYRDEAGRVVVSDRPPRDGRPYEVLEYHPERNVVPSRPPP
jgi:hypothetical protein